MEATITHPFPEFLWRKMKASTPTGPYFNVFLESGACPAMLLWGLSRQYRDEEREFWSDLYALYAPGDEVSEIDVLRIFGEYGVSMY